MGELIAAAELANAPLTAPSATTNLPTSPSITTAHVLSTRHHQRPSHRAYQEALSANNELMIVLLNNPACSNRDPLDGNLSGPPSATVFRSECITTVTPTARGTLANHVLHVLPSRCSAHLGVLRHLPPTAAASPTRNLPKIPFVAISVSLTYCQLFWVPAFYNLLAGCWIWCHKGNLL